MNETEEKADEEKLSASRKYDALTQEMRKLEILNWSLLAMSTVSILAGYAPGMIGAVIGILGCFGCGIYLKEKQRRIKR